MSEIFEFTMPIWEIIVRATVVYLVMIFFVRAIPSRNAGHISPNDLLTLIVVGTVGASAIIGDGTSIPDISLMIALIFGWSYVLDRTEYRIPALRRLLRQSPAMLIERGRLIRRNMRRELVTEEELMTVLRKEGIESIDAVQAAFMEADGEISVLAAKPSSAAGSSRTRESEP